MILSYHKTFLIRITKWKMFEGLYVLFSSEVYFRLASQGIGSYRRRPWRVKRFQWMPRLFIVYSILWHPFPFPTPLFNFAAKVSVRYAYILKSTVFFIIGKWSHFFVTLRQIWCQNDSYFKMKLEMLVLTSINILKSIVFW